MSTIITFAMLCLTAVVDDIFFFAVLTTGKFHFTFCAGSSEWDFGPPQKRLHRSRHWVDRRAEKKKSLFDFFRISHRHIREKYG